MPQTIATKTNTRKIDSHHRTSRQDEKAVAKSAAAKAQRRDANAVGRYKEIKSIAEPEDGRA